MTPLPAIFSIPDVSTAVALQALLGPIGPWLLILPLASLIGLVLSLWRDARAAHVRATSTAAGARNASEVLASAVRQMLLRLHETLTAPEPTRTAADGPLSDAA